ncbi:MAG: alkaline phosphatase family protein [Acidimicrobiia bacterium]|nr:alkaline phosphatase family protein [Acidimicrobiia bacterium]
MIPCDEPVLPDYGGGCVSNVMAELLDPGTSAPDWLPSSAQGDGPVVLFVLDGLGWLQLQERLSLAPMLRDLDGGPITTVAPSTTATALSSIATGLSPSEHGILGYRVMVDGAVLNILRWNTPDGDARRAIPPEQVQEHDPFLSQRPPVVSRAEFAASGFTVAHLRGGRYRGYRLPSSMVTEVDQALRRGEPFVYAYYDGLDKVSHEYGLGAHFDAELAACDRLVADLAAALPAGGRLVVIADHGQVETGRAVLEIPPDIGSMLWGQSGEARFRWLHAQPGQAARVLDEATDAFADHAWVRSRSQIIDEGWFGPPPKPDHAARLGDVALVARDEYAFVDPADSGLFELVGRHGSLTPDEMYVPLLSLHR